MCFRPVITAAARSLKLTGAEPGGPDRHFCKPADAMSISTIAGVPTRTARMLASGRATRMRTRSVRATLAMVDWAERSGQSVLLDSGYIARRSRHNLGVAVDLTLVDLVTGTEVPMGTPFDSFTPAAHTANATGRVQRYRQILVRAMESERFTNYDQEWWHFSYPLGDAVPFDRVIR